MKTNNTVTEFLAPDIESQAKPIHTEIHFQARQIEGGRVTFNTYAATREALLQYPGVEIHSVIVGLLPTEPGVFDLSGVDFLDNGSGWTQVPRGADFVVASVPVPDGGWVTHLISIEHKYYSAGRAMS